MFALFKSVHLATVAITLSLFVLRGAWMLTDSPRLAARWVRIVPHVNDALLLGSAIVLAYLMGQYPFVDAWLTAKLLALIAYIGLGTIALKRGRSKPVRVAAWLCALAVFAYIVAVAVRHDPLPWR